MDRISLRNPTLKQKEIRGIKMEKRFEVNGKEYFVKPASAKVSMEAQKVYTKAFKNAVEDGAILKRTLEDHMRRQGLWDDKKQEEYEQALKKSADIEYRIKSGVYKKASELRDKALELKKIRKDLSSLLMERSSMDSLTADGIADNQRFFYLVSACVCDYDTQKPVFSSLDEYLSKAEEELTMKLSSEYANAAYGIDEKYEDKFIENKVLRKLNLLNEKGELVNAEGQRIDSSGNLVNENGARIGKDGVRLDINNNPLIDDSAIDELVVEDDLRPKTE